ncbi:MAG TPA: (2Fe-2S)-binding protein [Pseudobdellovibrionaceae bacterium]|nr:(2Fe-2S)-binding protein [Pseudobdellovibrionaceae bacterium]
MQVPPAHIKNIEVDWLGRDQVEIEARWESQTSSPRLQAMELRMAVICSEVRQALQVWIQDCLRAGQVLEGPEGRGHAEMFVREVSLKLRDQFTPPFAETEMCHCRVVTTAQVDRAVVSGCHSPREVSRATTASTSCGTCRPDVEAWIRFRCEAR